MRPPCPKCAAHSKNIIQYGHYTRKSDSKRIPRYKCTSCNKYFSQATFSACFGQNKRRLNNLIQTQLCSLVSQRRFAKIHRVSRTTVKRKLEFVANQARLKQKAWLEEQDTFGCVHVDDLETIEHTKCKPVTVTMVVNSENRKIIDYCVAQIPAKGHLAKIARKKYGKRADHSRRERNLLFGRLKTQVSGVAQFHSDQHFDYPKQIQKHFPKAIHHTYKRRESCVAGQGELKKGGFDPLFSINHTFAMLRANINRLIRKTWCTSKKISALDDHIAMYVEFHNSLLT